MKHNTHIGVALSGDKNISWSLGGKGGKGGTGLRTNLVFGLFKESSGKPPIPGV